MKELKNLSQRTKLLLNMQEGYNLDFKRNADGLRAKDLVAFANSKYGKTILIGVEETLTKTRS